MKTLGRNEYTRPRSTLAASPFRYPGGKGFLTHFLAKRIEETESIINTYLEPYAGGAGAALNLLHSGCVDFIKLNDLDIRIYSAWRAILGENERFIEEIENSPVDLNTWRKYREIVDNPSPSYSFELGFATYFINRTSRAGIISGSGPIGGYKQEGKWTVDARYYKTTMTKRCKWIGQNADKIELSNKAGHSSKADS